MATTDTTTDDDLIGVQQAAGLVGRNPETIRRWIWSGRLAASKRGNRYVVSPADVEAASGNTVKKLTLAEWGERAREFRERVAQSGELGPGADGPNLVIEERKRRRSAFDPRGDR